MLVKPMNMSSLAHPEGETGEEYGDQALPSRTQFDCRPRRIYLSESTAIDVQFPSWTLELLVK